MESLSDVMVKGDWVFGSGVIVYGRSEGVSMTLELVDLFSVLSMG